MHAAIDSESAACAACGPATLHYIHVLTASSGGHHHYWQNGLPLYTQHIVCAAGCAVPNITTASFFPNPNFSSSVPQNQNCQYGLILVLGCETGIFLLCASALTPLDPKTGDITRSMLRRRRRHQLRTRKHVSDLHSNISQTKSSPLLGDLHPTNKRKGGFFKQGPLARQVFAPSCPEEERRSEV